MIHRDHLPVSHIPFPLFPPHLSPSSPLQPTRTAQEPRPPRPSSGTRGPATRAARGVVGWPARPGGCSWTARVLLSFPSWSRAMASMNCCSKFSACRACSGSPGGTRALPPRSFRAATLPTWPTIETQIRTGGTAGPVPPEVAQSSSEAPSMPSPGGGVAGQ